jgi:glycosyltransferase involved in cell wall biosynthesis
VRIAFINQPWNRVTIPVQSGSIAIWTYEAARRLSSKFETLVYAKRVGDDRAVERDEGVDYRRISVAPDAFAQRVARRLPVPFVRDAIRFDRSAYFLGYATRIAADIAKRGCDIVHIHNYSQFAPIVRRKNPRARIVLHMHCEWLTQIRRDVISRRLRSVDRVIGCSEYLTRTIREAFPEFADRCHTVHNGVNVQHFVPADPSARSDDDSAQTILFVGRISPEKGVHVLLDAFRRVIEEKPNTRLELIGPLGAAPAEFIVGCTKDPMVEALAPLFRGDYVASLKMSLPAEISAKVSFAGPVPYLELLKRYRAADVFVFPSVWDEPFGLPVVEAMACGLPVVATRSGGIGEIVREGETGLLAERADAKGLAGAMLRVLCDRQLASTMGIAGARRAREMFTWEGVAEALGSVYASTERLQEGRDGRG